MEQPRLPNKKERHQLEQFLLDEMSSSASSSDEVDNVRSMVENAAIAVFDNYVTDSPGYSGKLMTVVYSGGVKLYQVFIWRNGQLRAVRQDAGFNADK